MASCQDKVAQYQQEYNESIAAGTYSPFILPQAFLGYIILILYLLVVTNLSEVQPLYRYTVFGSIVSVSIWNMYSTRALEGTWGNMNGVLSAWCLLWSATFLIWTDPQHDFRRLERKPNGRTGPLEPELKDPPQYYWRGRPKSYFGRLFWTLDLLTNLRGRNWQWRFLRRSRRETASRLQHYREEQGPGLRTILFHVLMFVVCIDVGKSVMMQDPYYCGETDHEPWVLTPYSLLNHSLTSSWHTMLTFAGISVALGGLHTLQTLVCLHILGPSLIGISGEGWMYPPIYGPLSACCERGIKGWWGTFWHQAFRLPVTAAGTWAIEASDLDPQGQMAKYVRLLLAFTLSGAIHFAESQTAWPATSPWKSYCFFLLQPLGIAAQDAVRTAVWGGDVVQGKWATRALYAVNTVTTLLWFLVTFPLLGDDLARAGLWLAEPWPVSPTRALGGGFGLLSAEEGWRWRWRWQGGMVEWHKGRSLWQSGLRVL